MGLKVITFVSLGHRFDKRPIEFLSSQANLETWEAQGKVTFNHPKTLVASFLLFRLSRLSSDLSFQIVRASSSTADKFIP